MQAAFTAGSQESLALAGDTLDPMKKELHAQ
jgi:hypothetical protein